MAKSPKPFEFSSWTRDVLMALSAALIEESTDVVIQDKNDEMIRRCQILIREFPVMFRRAFVFGIYLFDRLPLFFGFGFVRFHNLTLIDKRSYLDKWMNSPSSMLRNIITGLRGYIMMSFFSHKDIWNYIGYDPVQHTHNKINQRRQLIAVDQDPARIDI